MIEVTLPDETTLELPEDSTVQDAAEKIDYHFGTVVGGKIDGEWVDASEPLEHGCEVSIIPLDSEEGRYMLRHTTAHVTAQAVCRLYPEAQLGVGPPIDNGYYYDFKVDDPFTPEDLEKIETEMEKIIESDLKIHRKEVSEDEAREIMQDRDQDLKLELIDQFQEGTVISMYEQGEFIDLCRGPHLPSTGCIPSWQVQRATGAYWRGDETRDQMQRIYGTAFPSESELEEHLERIEEAKKRDHRRLGQKLSLFDFSEVAPAHPIFLPKGTILYNKLIEHIREKYDRYGYQEVKTPQLYRKELWEQSGHAENYRENMYFLEDGEEGIKPMNCPAHTLIFSRDIRSYNDLPIRMADFGRLHRRERSGVTHGLTRVRSFQQDDAHIFCTPEQVQEEVRSVIQMMSEVYNEFEFDDTKIFLATRPPKSIGSDEMWNEAQTSLKQALENADKSFEIEEEDGAFYGPKVDFYVSDVLDRDWQLGTIQLDFALPERFDLEYITPDDTRERPVMIHRALLGSLERFLGILIEHYGGEFPLWLAPEQIRILPVSEQQSDYAAEIADKLSEESFRNHVDDRDETLSYRIRQGELQKVPYLLIVGDREVEAGNVSIRTREEGDIGSFPFHEFLRKIKQEVQDYRT